MTLIKRSFLQAKPQELGKIKIGGKGETRTGSGGREYQLPVKFDHFVVTTRVRGPDGNFKKDEAIHAVIGDGPTELRGMLRFPDVDENFHSEMVQYHGRSKVVECDGEICRNLKNGEAFPCPASQGGECPKSGNSGKGCKPYARLHLALWDSPDTGGYYVFRTTSWESANNIQTALEEIHALFGTLFNAPVRLKIYPSEDVYSDGDEQKTSTSYKVGLVLAMSLGEASDYMVSAKQRLDVTRSALRLRAGEVADDLQERDAEEGADISEEFFPPEGVEAASGTDQALADLKAEVALGAVVDGEIEADDEAVDEPEPLENDEQASEGVRSQLMKLLNKARERDLPDMLALEEMVSKALENGGRQVVENAVKDLSLAIVQANAGVGA